MEPGSAVRHLPYTWDDYRSWEDEPRWEVIGGEAFAMSPAPTVRHQRIVADLGGILRQHFRNRPCEALLSPVDVKLSDLDVVQPDILVVCREDQIHPTHVEGPPTLVIEVLSPSSMPRDRGVKMDLYARAGVPEVWLVTPYPACVEVYRLDGPGYRRHAVFTGSGILASPAFPDLRIGLADVFTFPPDPGEEPPAVQEPPGRYRAGAAAGSRS